MRASLDTNVVIHFFRAGLQEILFEFFDEGVYIYEQIRDIELENHGKDVLYLIDADIAAGRLEKYTDQQLKEQAIFRVFEEKVRENQIYYGKGDLGEVYAISLAQTLGTYSLVTDDIMPFTFADVLILRYLIGMADTKQTVDNFDAINKASDLNWSFRSQLVKFIKRFWKDPYREEDVNWIKEIVDKYNIKVKSKFIELSEYQNNRK